MKAGLRVDELAEAKRVANMPGITLEDFQTHFELTDETAKLWYNNLHKKLTPLKVDKDASK